MSRIAQKSPLVGPNIPGRILLMSPFNPPTIFNSSTSSPPPLPLSNPSQPPPGTAKANLRPPDMASSSLTPNLCPQLSFSKSLTLAPFSLPLNRRFPFLPPSTLTIRMGGGPRTFPGGVTKWQWKRMQAKKAKQLLKARLARERHIYEMRKRAELRAAVSELERPWEPVMPTDRAPRLFSVSADDQLKALADRFQKPGGFDMWTDRDGPQVFREGEEEEWSGSARFFPKGVVHSVKPYGRFIRGSNEKMGDEDDIGFQNVKAEVEDDDRMTGKDVWRRAEKKNEEVGFDREQRGRHNARRRGYRRDTNV